MLEPLTTLPDTGLSVLYDGQCPFCARYATMIRLREAVGAVSLVDARTRPDCVAEMRARGLEINETMLVQYEGTAYVGGDAIHMIALLSAPSGLWNRLWAEVMKRRRLARLLYPALRMGRNLSLRLMGHRMIP